MAEIIFILKANAESHEITAHVDQQTVFIEKHLRTDTGSKPAPGYDPDQGDIFPDDVVDIIDALRREGLQAMRAARDFGHGNWRIQPDKVKAYSTTPASELMQEINSANALNILDGIANGSTDPQGDCFKWVKKYQMLLRRLLVEDSAKVLATMLKPAVRFNRIKLRGQIAQAAETFRGYEAAHRTKNPPDIAKALRNKEEAESLEEGLAALDTEIEAFTNTMETACLDAITQPAAYAVEKRIREIEVQAGDGTMSAAEVFTQMRQLVKVK